MDTDPKFELGTPPVVEVTPTEVRWSGATPRRPWQPAPGAPSRMLDRFLAIEDRNDIESFARQYGVLSLCAQHGRPELHGPLVDPVTGAIDPCVPARRNGLSVVPVTHWLAYVGQARALMRIGEALHAGRMPAEDEWQVVAHLSIYDSPGRGLSSARVRFSDVVDGWLADAGARLRFWWDDERGPHLLFGREGAVVAIAVEVAQALLHAVHATCSGCGRLYRREGRRAAVTRMNFCEQCRADGTAERLRKARQRERARLRTEARPQKRAGTAQD